MRIRFERIFGFVFLTCALMVSGARAESRSTCSNSGADPEQRIEDCTQAIEYGATGGHDIVSAYLDRAAAYVADEDFRRAIQDYDEAVRQSPNLIRALNGACRLRAIANRELEVAAQNCNRALSLNPKNADTLESQAFVLLRQEQLVLALHDYDRALAAHARTASTLYMRGIVKRRLGDHAGADLDFSDAMELDGGISRTFAAYGLIDLPTADPVWLQKLAVARKLSAIKTGYQFSSRLLPDIAPEDELYDIEICAQSGDLERALTECRRVIANSGISGFPRAVFEGRCAEIEFLLGRYADAARDLRQASAHDQWNRAHTANLLLVNRLTAR